MLHLRLSLKNPFKTAGIKNVINRHGMVTKNKAWEIEYCKYSLYWLEFDFLLSFRGSDHAGPSLLIELFGHSFSFRIYDIRHWDYENNTWEEHDE